ncbi:uncharacterized protein LOC135962451 [Calliphora vicina]|uniref:uncharacterized protein LOC135962451 n=1 Tax=Calliphora vicina TaxID=7373 RepID=UPI00325A7AFF
MKHFIILGLIIVAIFLICKCQAEENISNNRKWLEIENISYRIEPDNKYTLKQAVAECIKDHSNLIMPEGHSNYAKLKDALKHDFKNSSSFWINSRAKWSDVSRQMNLASHQKCFKIDNNSNKKTTTFNPLPHDCEHQLGFICEKRFLNEFSFFNNGTINYLVQPNKEFTFEQASHQCQQRQMYLVTFENYIQNTLLKDYIFYNYNSKVSFWFDCGNSTDNNCATQQQHNKLGFICQQSYLKPPVITMRHWVLIILVTSTVCLAIIIKIIAILIRRSMYKKVKSFNLPVTHQTELPEAVVTTTIGS